MYVWMDTYYICICIYIYMRDIQPGKWFWTKEHMWGPTISASIFYLRWASIQRRVLSGGLTVCYCYWKWWFIDVLPAKNDDFPWWYLGHRFFSLRLKRMSEVMLKTSAISGTSSFERRQARTSFNSFRMVPPNDFSWFLKYIISINYIDISTINPSCSSNEPPSCWT